MEQGEAKSTKGRTKARIYALLARKVRKAVVFRRGPSKQVLCLVWDLANDTIEQGQWLKGRIYERRCDLSPDGQKLVYFAADFRSNAYSWTAVSRPPWLTAEYFFPKGDCWGGGGLFETNKSLRLNHAVEEAPKPELVKKGRRIPKYMRSDKTKGTVLTKKGLNYADLRVSEIEHWGGRGEDDPLLSHRLQRDGWVFSELVSKMSGYEMDADIRWKFDPPVMRTKSVQGDLSLRILLHGINDRDGNWYVETAALLDATGGITHDFGRIDWADFDHNGDILLARGGRIHRLLKQDALDANIAKILCVADLNALKFEERTAPYSTPFNREHSDR